MQKPHNVTIADFYHAEIIKIDTDHIYTTPTIIIHAIDDFKVVDGHPTFDKKYQTFNALGSANKYIRHEYRQGWSLPPIPA